MTTNIVKRAEVLPAEQKERTFAEKLVANPIRGKTFHDLAVAFVTEFPINTKLTTEQFDAWSDKMKDGAFKDDAEKLGLFATPNDMPANSIEWRAHITDRNNLRYNIKKASEHPRMYDRGSAAFTIRIPAKDTLVVTTPETAIGEFNLRKAVEDLFEKKKQQLLYLQQSVDYKALGNDLKYECERVTDEIERLEHDLKTDIQYTEKAVNRFRDQVARKVQIGAVTPQNGAIDQLIKSDDIWGKLHA
jgi:hypothetical protein